MKVIFLDVDGVLVTEKHLLDLLEQGKRITDHKGRHWFDPKCVENLGRILSSTNAKIVLSSAWKMFGIGEFREIWRERTCPGEIFDFTPNKLSGSRGHEISIWLNDHVGLVESFVIIDDIDSDLFDNQISRVVKTTWEDGLTDDAAEKAINILNFVEL